MHQRKIYLLFDPKLNSKQKDQTLVRYKKNLAQFPVEGKYLANRRGVVIIDHVAILQRRVQLNFQSIGHNLVLDLPNKKLRLFITKVGSRLEILAHTLPKVA